MALIMPCTFCTSLQRRNFPINLRYCPNFRRGATTTTCEFRIPVEVSTPSDRGSLAVPSHKVTVHDRQRGVVHEFEVPEDQYILHSAESQNITLPFACRHGCCTSCAVRVKSGELRQPQALGISAELKSQVISLFLRLARDTSGLELRRQFVMVRVCVCEKLGPTLIESTEQCKASNNYSIVRLQSPK